MSKKNLFVLGAFLLIGSLCFAQSASNGQANNSLNFQASMSLELPGGEPEGFRGSNNPDDKHYLEDCGYKASENSLIYVGKGKGIASGTVATGSPSINWTITNDNDPRDVRSRNTNVATNTCDFTDPGTYKVHNSGSRQLTDAGGVGGPDAATNTARVATDTTSVASATSGIATANQVIPVIVHDVTAPDVWIAIQELAGDKDSAATEEELEAHVVDKMMSEDEQIKRGRPFVTSKNDRELETTSYIFVDEGDERNITPDEKVVRYTIAGAAFNERGVSELDGGIVKTTILDKDDKTRQAVVEGSEESKLKGLFVRRNVPFIVLVRSIDNGDKRKTIGSNAEEGVSFVIKDKNGKEIEKSEDGYIFRVPNYPRAQYNDQPDYYFEAKAYDASKNLTVVKAPLYVVNTAASFEGSTRR